MGISAARSAIFIRTGRSRDMKKAKHGIEAKLQTVEQPFAEELLDHELEYVTGGTTHSQHNQHNRGGELED